MSNLAEYKNSNTALHIVGFEHGCHLLSLSSVTEKFEFLFAGRRRRVCGIWSE
jgi:hypothetical protein